MPGELERLVSLEEDVGRVRPERDARRRVVVHVLEKHTLVLGHVHRRAGSLGQVGDAAEVVPVAVRDEDRDALGPALGQLEPDLGRVRARIDDDRLGRAGVADEVAVRPDRAELEARDVKGHQAAESIRAGLHSPAMESWSLPEIPTPEGSRSPVVLRSADEARAVLIGLDPGQELGDHQVKEHAWIVVVEGRAEFEAGGVARRRARPARSCTSSRTSGTRFARPRAPACCSSSRRGPARATTAATRRPSGGRSRSASAPCGRRASPPGT